jgi:transposase
MARTVLTNSDWKQLAPLFPKRGPAKQRRRRLEGILWVHRTGAPWRDVPRCFGPWRSVRSCFERWSDSGLWAHIWETLRALLGEDHEALYLDSTSVKAHRHSAGARGKGQEAIGRSRGGRGTKLHAVCDGLGYPLAVALTAAQESDVAQAAGLLEGRAAGQVVADRGYDSDPLRETIKARGAEPVIPGRKHRTVPVEFDRHCYGSRHVIENFFCRIKDHRRVATRYEKTARMFGAMVLLSCILVWLQR